MFNELTEKEELLGKEIVNCVFTVHKQLGPGLLEKVYEACLVYEITKAGLEVKRQVEVPIIYDGVTLKEYLRLDIIVENSIIIEVKAVENTFYVYNTEIEHKEFTIPDDYPINCHEHFLPIYVKTKGVKSIEQVHAYLGHSNLKGNYILMNISSQIRHKVCKVIRRLVF